MKTPSKTTPTTSYTTPPKIAYDSRRARTYRYSNAKEPTTSELDSTTTTDSGSPPVAQAVTAAANNDTESTRTIREGEELMVTVCRYVVKVGPDGTLVSRELLDEKIVEKNMTSPIEPWPEVKSSTVNETRRPTVKDVQPPELTRKKSTKSITPKRKIKDLKPTAADMMKTRSLTESDDDSTSKNSKDGHVDESEKDESGSNDEATDDVSGDEFTPLPTSTDSQPLSVGSRVFCQWFYGHFYPGAIRNIVGGKFVVDSDDGAGSKRDVKANEILCQSHLQLDQDGFFDRGPIKRLIKKRKTGKLGYVIDKNGKEKWYPMRCISPSAEQAGHLPRNHALIEDSSSSMKGKRKRTSTAPQSPNKKTKNTIVLTSPNKSQRSAFTPTRQEKLFNTMYFLLTGFNNIMEMRQIIQDSIESHGGKVIEKMATAARRDNVYLVSDIARQTAKFCDAKKSNIPCINYQWIEQSVNKNEVQDWKEYQLILPEKQSKTINNTDDEQDE